MESLKIMFSSVLFIGLIAVFIFVVNYSDWRPIKSKSWFEFDMQWNDGKSSFVYAGKTKPAGSKGFVDIGSSGDFVLQNGDKIRFWGASIAGRATIPPKDESPLIARRIAKLGFNLVRVTRLGRFIVDKKSSTGVEFNDQALDRFDFFIKELKKNGIYVELCLIGPWRFHTPEKIQDSGSPNYTETYEGRRLFQSLGTFDPSIFTVQKQYARKLLTHQNPYTENEYSQEPALATIEVINETTLNNGWLRGYLKSNSSESPHLTEHYSRELDMLWNIWLRNKYGSTKELREAWKPKANDQQALSEDASLQDNSIKRIPYEERINYPRNRQRDMVEFYYELEEKYFLRFKKFLKEDLGLEQPISGAHNYHGMPNQMTQAQMDFSGGHAQWQHPIMPRGEAWPIRILNTPMVKGQMDSIPYKADWIETRNTIFRIAFGMASAGQPMVVSEYNHAFPNEYLSEFPLLIGSYGLLQGWDGVVIHSYMERLSDLKPSKSGIIDHPFITFNNPALMAQMPLVSTLFREGYVDEAGQSITLNYTEKQSSESFLTCGFDLYCETDRLGVNPRLALTHQVNNNFSPDSDSTIVKPTQPNCKNDICVSDTDQLIWNIRKGLVMVNSKYAQAAVGFPSGRSISLKNLKITPKTDFMSLGLVPLDDKPIEKSEKLLLTATSRVKNKGMDLKKDLIGLYRINSWGSGPTMVQDVQANLDLELPGKDKVQVYALNPEGLKKKKVEISRREKGVSFVIGGHDTLWYGITVER